MYDEHGWTVEDDASSEVELRVLLTALMYMLKPKIVVETGCFLGRATVALAIGLGRNDPPGQLVTCDVDADMVEATRERLERELGSVRHGDVEVLNCRGDKVPELPEADFIFCDSDYRCRAREIELAKPGAIVLVHDTRISYDADVEPLEGLVRSLGGVCFDSYRGWGLLRKA